MKVGDYIYSTKVRPWEKAKIIRVEICTTLKETDKGPRSETRTTYTAEYDDKSTTKFYGFNINKSIFKCMESNGQMVLDFLGEHERAERCHSYGNDFSNYMTKPVDAN